MKKFLLSCLTTVLAVTLCIGTFTGGVYGVDDPADTYEKQQAEYEDESLSLWFEHSFKKVMTSDITPSGMYTWRKMRLKMRSSFCIRNSRKTI